MVGAKIQQEATECISNHSYYIIFEIYIPSLDNTNWMHLSSSSHTYLASTELMWKDTVDSKSCLASAVNYFEFHSNRNRFMTTSACTANVLSKEPETTLSCWNLSSSSDLKAQLIMNSTSWCTAIEVMIKRQVVD